MGKRLTERLNLPIYLVAFEFHYDAPIDEVYGGVETRVDLCSPGLSPAVSTKLVNTLSPSSIGGCLVQMGLVLWRECVSGSFLGGSDFIGEEAFFLAVPVNLARFLVVDASFGCFSIFIVVTGYFFW